MNPREFSKSIHREIPVNYTEPEPWIKWISELLRRAIPNLPVFRDY